MSASQEAINSAIAELEKLKARLQRTKSKQVTIIEEKSLIKAVAQTWFSNHRSNLLIIDQKSIETVDLQFKEILAASDRSPARKTLITKLKETRQLLINLRSGYATALASPQNQNTFDQPPNFSTLVADIKMQAILKKRWIECSSCLSAEAPLAATVMIGGLLEALLLARVNQHPIKAQIFKAKSAPKNKTGGTLPLKDWGLKNYIDVAHELKWISQPAKVLSDVLRDYRNYIHPNKEYSLGIEIGPQDAKMFWEIAKNLSRQLLAEAKG